MHIIIQTLMQIVQKIEYSLGLFLIPKSDENKIIHR